MKKSILNPKNNYRKNTLAASIVCLLLIFSGLKAMSNSHRALQNASKTASTPMLRLQMSGLVNSLDETVIYYQSGATTDFDSEYDSYKLFGPNPAPHISQESNSLLIAINGIQPVAQTFSINIKATTHVTGNFTITATDFANLPKGTCVYLHDLATGITANILTTPYAFNLSSTTSASRFILSITHYRLPITAILTQPSCQLTNGGKFKVSGLSNTVCDFVWRDSAGTIIQTTVNGMSSDSLENLTAGNYTVEITSAGNGCYYSDTLFSIATVILPNVSFIAPDTLTASIMANYTIINQSSNCVGYHWDFGDATGHSTLFEPTYNYATAGMYEVKLIGESPTGCIDSTQKQIDVISLATTTILKLVKNITILNSGNNMFKIICGDEKTDDLSINLINLNGENLLNQRHHLTSNEEITIDLNNISLGVYILSIGQKDKVIKNLKIYIE